jgi:hypothetical protein
MVGGVEAHGVSSSSHIPPPSTYAGVECEHTIRIHSIIFPFCSAVICFVTAAAAERIARKLSSDSTAAALTAKALQSKLERGQQTADRGRFTRLKDGAYVLTVASIA